MPARATRRVTVTVLAVLAVFAVAACDGAESPGMPSTPSATSAPPTVSSRTSTTQSEQAAQERAAVEASYRNFWRVGQSFDRDYPPGEWRTVLGRVATDPVLSRALSGAQLQRQNGIVLYGQVGLRPTVRSIDPEGRAEVSDCQDTSRTGQADAKTGARRTVGVPRAPVTATLLRGVDGRWRVSDTRYTGGRC